MTDRISKEARSRNMSKVKGKNTKPELVLFEALDLLGIKYEKHYPVDGNPDLAIPGIKLAIFVDGEFWHGRYYDRDSHKWPFFWKEKIAANIKRDKRKRTALRMEGWKVIRIWDKDILKNPKKSALRVKNWNEKLAGKTDL